MRITTLVLTTATLLGALTLGVGSASAATPDGLQASGAPTAYTAMMGRKKMMMMKKKRMMHHHRSMHHRKMMMKKRMM
ncbi:hypothetical protein HCU64_05025 [Methylobacterium sp. C25]|uniref:hypothetical protein n=1 Tax=Methylobacterium sp. C25 TaxID=2721622 RepID=UPI001F2668B9|nr:hypothetical protein [Methylobacterium sp. C25]MCE4223104.1 hypothetical protein [Methylobacterium sp. C25]